MAQINVTQFAKELGLPVTLLLEQLQTAGIAKALADDTVLTEKDKTQLLDYLRQAHGAKEAKNRITLTRKQTTEIKKADATGKPRTIQVEVRKKRVLVKRDVTPEVVLPEPVVAAPIIDAAQTAIREAEAKKQAELIALQSEEAFLKQSRVKKKKEDSDPVVESVAAPAAEPVVVQEVVVETPPVTEPVVVAATDGTLHKPQPKPGEAPKVDKKAKKTVKDVVWRDDAVKRRGIKTRGDAAGNLGWRTRKDKHAGHREEDDQAQHGFAAPAEPIVRDISS